MPGSVLYFGFPVLQLSQLPVTPSNWSELTPANNNCTYGVQWIWYVMGQCVVDARGMVAIACGLVSLFSWIMGGLPQIVENFRTGIPDQALSPFLILFWTFGDSINLVGCLLTHQLILQVAISVYGVCSDLILLGQFLFYKMRHQFILKRVSETLGDGEVYMEDNPNEADPATMDTEPLLNVSTPSHRALAVCFVGLVGLTTFHSILPAFPESSHAMSSPFSRRLLMFTPPEAPETVVTHLSYQEDWHPPFLPGTNAKIGYMLGWISSLMYFGSRFPQIFKNWRRRSTEGLCPALFFASLLGNTSYGLQIFVTSTEPIYLLQALPWLFGSVGVLALDFIICFQFYYFARHKPRQFSPLGSSAQDESLSNSLSA
ncbi:Lysosomal amino acid transporter 1 [Clonorchis sinensis]|uniref:Lysosomal amino acid transporter 1 n=2 Tax=Clonorchis sinensis TaxID=79923 RepID=A0A8T1MFT6_CLOSI|nr:Lysosomal amino acid transporter 1 [Clonorchis sinensis]GAA48565.1 translation initiation factor 3 subunit H [Clonorchis sinensis]